MWRRSANLTAGAVEVSELPREILLPLPANSMPATCPSTSTGDPEQPSGGRRAVSGGVKENDVVGPPLLEIPLGPTAPVGPVKTWATGGGTTVSIVFSVQQPRDELRNATLEGPVNAI